MKFNGQPIRAMAEKEIALPRPDGNHLFVRVRALGLGEEREARRLFPDPVPPHGFYEDEKGKPLRDPDTGKVESGPLFSDPTFLEAVDETERLRTVVKFVRALEADERIEFTASGEDANFYREAQKEIEEAGISEGDMMLVIRTGIELGNLDQNSIKRAAEAFSSREQAQA